MRVPDIVVTIANLTPAPTITPAPVQAPIPVTPPPSVGSDLLHLSSQATNANPQAAGDPAGQRQALVGALMQAMAGQHPLPQELSLSTTSLAPTGPGTTLPTGTVLPGAPGAAATAGVTAPDSLVLRFPVAVITAQGGRLSAQAEVTLHPSLIRYEPALARALAESVIGRPGTLLTMQLPQLPVPEMLGFQVMLNPASMWPLNVAIASGILRLRRPEDEERDRESEHVPPGEDDGSSQQLSVGETVRRWLALHEQRMDDRRWE